MSGAGTWGRALTLVDISTPLTAEMTQWPGSPPLAMRGHLSLAAGDPANTSIIEMDVHTGTHVDAPRHVFEEGETVDGLDLEALLGPAWVADATGYDMLDDTALEGLAIPSGTSRLLLLTDNSLRPRGPFREDFVALTSEGARWVVDRGIALVGIDYLSIQGFRESQETHRALLSANVVVLEGLDLRDVKPGDWTLVCLPLRLGGAEAAPARAVLLEDGRLA